MPDQWVINASPLIVLCKINHQHLFSQLTPDTVIPQAVAAEINVGPEDDAVRLFLATSPFPVVEVVPDPVVLAWDLGAGETAVLSHTLANPGYTAILDDGAARRCGRTLGVPLLGTLGLILRARQADLIPAAVPVLKALQDHGFRLDDNLIRTVLPQTVAENWD